LLVVLFVCLFVVVVDATTLVVAAKRAAEKPLAPKIRPPFGSTTQSA